MKSILENSVAGITAAPCPEKSTVVLLTNRISAPSCIEEVDALESDAFSCEVELCCRLGVLLREAFRGAVFDLARSLLEDFVLLDMSKKLSKLRNL